MTHIPYRTMSQLVGDLVSGEAPVSFSVLSNVSSSIQAGQVRALAVTADKRLAALPNVPTAADAGVSNFEASAWFALLAPLGTPRPIVDQLNRELAAALSDPIVRERFSELGAVPAATTPEELASFISSEISKWRDVMARTGIGAQPE